MARELLYQISEVVRDKGGEAWFFGRIADGASMQDIADELPCSRAYIYTWGKSQIENWSEKLAEARKLSAEAHAEDAGQILEDLAADDLLTPARVSLANSRSNYRKWLAEVRDRETFGDRKDQVNVHLSVGALHLDALRNRGTPEVLQAEEPEPELLEAEVVE